MGKAKKLYAKPEVIELTAEQAREKLIRLANRGDPKAKHLLETMFPKAPHKDPKHGKKSA